MSETFDSCMKRWVAMVNESTFSYNPDDAANDSLDA
jgi:hypothetical protein